MNAAEEREFREMILAELRTADAPEAIAARIAGWVAARTVTGGSNAAGSPEQNGVRSDAEARLRRLADHRASLLNVSRMILESRSSREALVETLFASVGPQLGADVCFNYELEADGQSLRLAVGIGIPAQYRQGAARLQMGQAFCGTVAQTLKPLTADAVRIRTDAKGAFVRAMGVHAYACHPILNRDGTLRGTFSLASTARSTFEAEDVEFLQTLCHLLSIAWERSSTEQALERQRELLKETGAMAHVGGWEFDVATGRGAWTDEVARIHDLPEGEVPTAEQGLQFYQGAAREKIEAAVHAAVEEGKPYDLELELVTRKGVRKWVRTIGHPVIEDGRTVRVRGAFQEITARKVLEAQFLQAQRLEAVGALAAGVAHDLNNVLAPILMAAPLLRDSVVDPEEKAMLETVETCARRGADIIRQLLTFARGAPEVRVPLPVRHLLRELDAMMRETFPKNIEIEVSVPADLWQVVGDATQVHQAMLNLCVNARDAMPNGGWLRLAARNLTLDESWASMVPDARPGRYVCLTSTDSGSGIPPENIGRIFDPFFTTKPVGTGTGLGLASVLGIVRGHGGFVRVESAPGQGAVFELYFPAALEAPSVVPARRGVLPPRADGQGILIVDDEPAVRLVAKRILEHHGYQVFLASEGDEALRVFLEESGRIRVVLTDIMMPGMDGPTLVQRLRQHSPSLPVLGMTGLAEQVDYAALESLGLAGELAKPFTAEALLRAVRRAVVGAPATL